MLTTPIIRCVKKQLNAEIHYLTKESHAPILQSNPYVDRIHSIQQDTSEAIGELKQLKWDFVIDLHKNIRSFQVRRALKATVGTFDKINLAKWLKVNLKIDILPNWHIVDRYFMQLKL